VNTYLIERLAKEGRGSPEYVGPEASVEVAMGSLLGKIRRPALVNLRIVDSPVRLVDVSPAALPDLFFGEELVVLGRYQGTGSGTIVIEGERNGRRERFTAEASFPRVESDDEFIPRLWASRRIGDLTRQIRLEGNSEALVRQVRDLGLRYGILTEYTSYLVQEPGVVAVGRREDMLQARGAAASPAPSAQTGQLAFEKAQKSANLTSTMTLAEADEAAVAGLAKDARAKEARTVSGRIFTLQNGVWTDVAHEDSLRVVSVAPYSDAYFALVRAIPELGQYMKLGDEIIIAGRTASIRVTQGGARTLSAQELSAAVKGFRGA
jgi:Ca-activated chloride channel family protein